MQVVGTLVVPGSQKLSLAQFRKAVVVLHALEPTVRRVTDPQARP